MITSVIINGPAERENQFKQNKISSEEKVKFTSCTSRENEKKSKKFMRDNFGADEEEQLKIDDKNKNKKKQKKTKKTKKKKMAIKKILERRKESFASQS